MPCSFADVGNIAITARKFVINVRSRTKRNNVFKVTEAANLMPGFTTIRSLKTGNRDENSIRNLCFIISVAFPRKGKQTLNSFLDTVENLGRLPTMRLFKKNLIQKLINCNGYLFLDNKHLSFRISSCVRFQSLQML